MRPANRAPLPSSGFSLLEVLLAGCVLSLVLLAIAPLFVRATRDRLAGGRQSRAGTYVADRHAVLRVLPLEGEWLTPVSGEAGVELGEVKRQTEHWDPLDGAERAAWTRWTRVRLFSVTDLVPGSGGSPGRLGEPLPADAAAELVHLRSLQVEVDGTAAGGLEGGGERRVELRSLRAF